MPNDQVDHRRSSPAALRNQTPILNELNTKLDRNQNYDALEIASGTGEHALYFSTNCPNIHWLPSEHTDTKSIEAWRATGNFDNFKKPILVDVTQMPKTSVVTPNSYDLVYSANMIHIAPLNALNGLMRWANWSLKNSGLLFIYGPFIFKDIGTSASNLEFDLSLRQRNSEWGIRTFEQITDAAKANALEHVQSKPMPANNFALWFKKKALHK